MPQPETTPMPPTAPRHAAGTGPAHSAPRGTAARPAHAPADAAVRGARTAAASLAGLAAAAALLAATPARAVDFGPFSLTGFAKVEATRTTNVCEGCQREDGENRQRQWADDIRFGQPFGTRTSEVTLFQPYLGFQQRVGGGWDVFGLLSQRWRDGKVDLEGWLYERNVGVAHEDWGRLTVGAMTTRGWSVPDFPSGMRALSSDFWGGGGSFLNAFSDAGAGYGLLSRAVRYMSRPIYLFDGDVLLEVTYDFGKSGWQRNEPRFLELYAKYIARDINVDLVVQSARNGEPVAWGKAPFGGLTPFPEDDPLLGGSSQGMAMLIVRKVLNGNIELSGGVRFNEWSGAYAVQTTTGPLGRWNNMFNVDWGGVDANGVPNPGYKARSTDVMVGARYRYNEKLTFGAGLVHLGKASTDNPSERGQSNTLTVGTFSAGYNATQNLQLFATASAFQYGRKGLAPLSVPSHSAFTNIDSRVADRGNALSVGANLNF